MLHFPSIPCFKKTRRLQPFQSKTLMCQDGTTPHLRRKVSVQFIFNFASAMFRNPGYTEPVKDKPQCEALGQYEFNAPKGTFPKATMPEPLLYAPRWCQTCKNFKPLRSHHCRVCQRCVLRMDHHSPFTSNCIGLRKLDRAQLRKCV